MIEGISVYTLNCDDVVGTALEGAGLGRRDKGGWVVVDFSHLDVNLNARRLITKGITHLVSEACINNVGSRGRELTTVSILRGGVNKGQTTDRIVGLVKWH